ncbi:MAG TPA: response regulator, partial [Aquabacterium sp.]|nr:response regulator [Aquabacterium sp.]
MPEMDGFEATRQIRQREGQTGRTRVPIVALTANVLSDERSLCLEVGMDDHLAKPFESDDLRRVVQHCMTNAPLLRVL